MSIVDVECGWMVNHEYLINSTPAILMKQSSDQLKDLNHGTAVLGILCAEDNTIGVVGIAPNIHKVVCMYPSEDNLWDIGQNLQEGDVLLLETGATLPSDPNTAALPIEIDPLYFNIITLAISYEIVVIEPAGNKTQDLDSYQDPNTKKYILNRATSDFLDSGAIMIGAASQGYPHSRTFFSSLGNRIDSYAQGKNVITCQYYDSSNPIAQKYQHIGGTSAAGAIIAGAALSIQGIAKKHRGHPLTPETVRRYFSSPLFGTPSRNPAIDRIDVMPDLKKIADSVIQGPKIRPLTPTVSFVNAGFNAASFEVNTFEQTITLEIVDPPVLPFDTTILGSRVIVDPLWGSSKTVQIWFQFIPLTLSSNPPPQTIKIACMETLEEWDVTLTGRIESEPYLAILLLLDQSGSMNDAAGDTGLTRIELLRNALLNFLALVPYEESISGETYPGNVLGAASFATNAKEEIEIYYLEDINSVSRLEDFARNFSPLSGKIANTAISKGLLVANEGGYTFITDLLTESPEDWFRLSKYFTQILLDLTAQEVTVDPSGIIFPDQLIQIPFVLNETDLRAEVVLLTDIPLVSLELVTPDGTTIAENQPGVKFQKRHNMCFFRFALPLLIDQEVAHIGTWHARLKVIDDEPRVASLIAESPGEGRIAGGSLTMVRNKGIRYNLSVHTKSNLRIDVQAFRRVVLLGEPFYLRVVSTEFGVPVEERMSIKAQIKRPDGTEKTIELTEIEPGCFEEEILTPIPGVFHIHLFASGKTLSGHSFTREKILSFTAVTKEEPLLPDTKDTPWWILWLAQGFGVIILLLLLILLRLTLY